MLSMLECSAEELHNFSIQAGRDFELRHSQPGLTMRMRFLCIKGAVEQCTEKNRLRIRW